ncbi:glutathione S-transferase family protein [Lentibacter algarum]|uniref:glutathione S-transferase family protein n=1 Tax=Lentibacter algarum TaxID=576131 RepID=UPI001C079EE7|nr:glutathione S-transferase family protein [Lentibacter algarum]MBU2982067.1 glutathione S-transferase family protein [Lentibacter algarum]
MITLHHVPQSRSMRVLWLLHELEVPFQVVIHPFDKSLRSPEFLSLSPAGRVPALEIEGERMFESGAMIEYLCERFSEERMGRMPGTPDRMAWLTWLHFAETVSAHAATLTQQHIMLYDDKMRSPYVMKLEAARLAKCYEAIEARLSTPIENRDYLLTSGFSAVDIAVGQAVYIGKHFAKIDAFPELSAWYERISGRESFQASLPQGEQRVYEQEFYPAWPLPKEGNA